MLRVWVDGLPVQVTEGSRLTSALGLPPVACSDLSGAPRGPLCGIGQCFECRLQVDGREALACLLVVREGMQVRRG